MFLIKKADIPVRISVQAIGNILSSRGGLDLEKDWGRGGRSEMSCVQVFHHQWMGLLHSITEHVLQCIIGAASSSTESKGSKFL